MNGLPDLTEIVTEFLRTHFEFDHGSFASIRDDSVLGNLRFGWSHYMVSNVEVAMLTADVENERFQHHIRRARLYGDVGTETCYMEIFNDNFHITTIAVLKPINRENRLHPSVMIRTGTRTNLVDFKFAGDLRSALAHFTFAKLSK